MSAKFFLFKARYKSNIYSKTAYLHEAQVDIVDLYLELLACLLEKFHENKGKHSSPD